MRSYPELPKTRNALYDQPVRNFRRQGVHESSRLKVSTSGRKVYEIPYEPTKHHNVTPNPLSIQSIIYEKDYVSVRHPNTRMNINVVVHADARDRAYAEWVTATKDRTMETIAGAMSYIRSNRGDRAITYVVGDASRLDPSWVKSEAYDVIESEDPEISSEAINDICLDGLTVVISSFRGMVLNNDMQQRRRLPSPVGIKVNHLFELELQPNTGTFATGEKENPYIHTSDPLQLNAWNEILSQRHQAVLSDIGNKGIALAQVVFKGKATDPSFGFDIKDADISIAGAIAANENAF